MFRGWFLCSMIAVFAVVPSLGQQSAPQLSPGGPVLVHRPPPEPLKHAAPVGRIQLDVVVTDAAGKAVTGLEPTDFRLLDNGQPRKILSFRSFDGIAVKPDPPVALYLVVDTVNNGLVELAYVRKGVEEFLRQNGGHLAQPTSIILLSASGLKVQSRPSVDGIALLDVLKSIQPSLRPHGEDPIQVSVGALALITNNLARQPGRKIVLWLGTGWQTHRRDASVFTEVDARLQAANFTGLVSISEKLRQGQITLCGGYALRDFHYEEFLPGVKSASQFDFPHLALEIFAIHSGGSSALASINRDSDLVDQINSYIANANAYYQISFDPPPAQHADEYHDIKLEMSNPALTAHTNTGYYNQPTVQ
jgi:VWFA-related protein